ncbi:NADH-quinone oxidoreductase subunit NuoF [Candidatus Aerophobetes bacterium]|uniref:NADH-quinone oxidoreductase subunit NuoF n=1 Tax=Aerophobetes bacterium TaxID=2030807 RepID=A0A662D5T1_UNCAE|nr:MAG: NADH-quinone oxidoreductase subunit NuoF [Candidatus Aerophobetes bacterium]
MKLYRSHILVGIDASTLLAGAKAVEELLIREIEKQRLSDEVKVLETGSLGITNRGVILLVYPEGCYYVNVKTEDVPEIVEEHLLKGRIVKRLLFKGELKKGPAAIILPESPLDVRRQSRVVLQNCGVINPEDIDEYIGREGYKALEKALFQMKPQEVIEEVKKSGLVGRGGAGFPTGVKWDISAKTTSKEKYIICNADEGEPGTFKDRVILEGDPHRIIEGMLLAGYAVGANKGFIYIRGEYALSIQRMKKAIEQAYEYNLLGNNILETDFSFDIEMRKGAGAYICGEETALIESLEGKRGEPRNKPPYPGTYGLWGKPTVVNNVETLANIPSIIIKGADWFRSRGTRETPGTKLYTILGQVINQGVIEVETGITLRKIVFDYGGGMKDGKEFKAALVGGAAGCFLSKDMLDVKMDYATLKSYKAVLGSGAVLVMDNSTCIVDMLKCILGFFRHESCGKCVPCRMGTDKLYRMVSEISTGMGTKDHPKLMLELAQMMNKTSFCPLGQSVLLPVSSALKYFEDEIMEHILNRRCPVGVCNMR